VKHTKFALVDSRNMTAGYEIYRGEIVTNI